MSGNDSLKPLFLTENHLKWRLNGVIFRRPIKSLKFFFWHALSDWCRGESGTYCHFFQNWLWCTHFQQLVFHTLLVYSIQQELWCFGCISIGFDVRVGYVSMRHLTEPAPYTGQVLSPVGEHSVSDGTHPFITAAIQCPYNISFQFVPLILVNHNI